VAFVEYTGLCNRIEIDVCFVFMAVDYCRFFFIVLCHVYHLLQGVIFCLSLFVCVFLSVSWQLHVKITRRIFMKFFFRNLLWTRKNFWRSPTSGSKCRNFLKDSSTQQNRMCFHNSAHFSEKLGRIFTKIFIVDLLLNKEVPTISWKSSGSWARIWTTDWLVIKVEYNEDRCQCRVSFKASSRQHYV